MKSSINTGDSDLLSPHNTSLSLSNTPAGDKQQISPTRHDIQNSRTPSGGSCLHQLCMQTQMDPLFDCCPERTDKPPGRGFNPKSYTIIEAGEGCKEGATVREKTHN